MRILLTTLNAKYIHTNLAIRILYEQNHAYPGLEWKEFTIKEPQQDVADFCAQFDVVAFSCYIWNITQTLEVAKKIKSNNPQTKILLGGPEVSYEYDDIISLEQIDYVIAGEGETPFAEFLNSFPNVSPVPGLVYLKEGKVISNPLPMQFDVKKFEESMPYRFDNPADLANKVLYIETSRGCPYKCEFCLASLDNKVRYLPDNSIKSTLLFLMQNGKVIKFLDRTFNIKRDFTLDIFKFILENRRPENVFQFEITADILHPDIIKFIHEFVPKGLFRFEIGIQTVNQSANLEVSRKQSFEKTKKIIKELDYKIEMHLDLIVGLPLDYWNDIKFSIEEVFKLYAPEMQLGFLKFLKGTTMRQKEQHQYVYDPLPPYQIIESKYLSKQELEKIVLLENALEIYWNSKKATNTLTYVAENYSIFDFLLGLGTHFKTRREFHKYSLVDVFEIMTEFSDKNYGTDKILKQLIAIDYHLHFKVKPQTRFMEEIPKHEKNKLVQDLKLNYHKYRYTVLPIDFNFHHFKSTNEIKKQNQLLILQYSGTTKAEAINVYADATKELA